MKMIERIKLPNGRIRVRVYEDMTHVDDDGQIVPSISLTDESFAKDCDVNEIVKRFDKTGQISHLSKKQGVYADLSEVTDLLDMSIKIEAAHSAFMDLPSSIREKLNNDPTNLPLYLSDPKNEDELIKLGIKIPKKSAGSQGTESSKTVKNEDSKSS